MTLAVLTEATIQKGIYMSEENNNSAPEAVEVEETETVEDIDTESAQPVAPSKEEKELQKLVKSYELKVNGKSKKIDIDINNDEEVKRYIQKGLAADENMQSAAQSRKQAEQLVEMLQKNPLAILRNPALGIDVRQLAELILNEQLEEAKLSPEQKKIKELEKALTDREEREKTEKETKDSAERTRLTKEVYERTEQDMLTALEKSDIGASPYAVRRVADMMSALIEEGYEEVTIEKIMPFAEKLIMQELGGHFSKNRSPDKLEKLLGKDILKEYRKSKISKVLKTPSNNTQDTGKKTADEQPKEVKKIKLSDFGSW